ncbi:MAG: phage regulatory CII family protein [Cyanobacteria bacterium P01_F01_bin.3]
MEQVVINFEAGLTEAYPSLKELMAERIHRQAVQAKFLAAELGMSPSDLSRKLAPSKSDNKRNFCINDLVRFIEVTNDLTPVYWLAEKFLTASEVDRLKARLAELEGSQSAVRGVA